MKPFDSPLNIPDGLDAGAAERIIASASDLALLLDENGTIRDLSLAVRDLLPDAGGHWIGRRWLDVVTVESRPKVEALLHDALAPGGVVHPRHVNHPVGNGRDLAILYTAVRVGSKGPVIALGRDLSALATLQQRLVDAQQAIERDYGRMRQLEARYRLLFQTSTEAVLMVDAASHRVLEANDAAVRLLGVGARGPVGRNFPDGLDEAGTQAVQALFATVRSTGRGEDLTVRRTDGSELRVAAALVRQDTAALYLVRLASACPDPAPATDDTLAMSDAMALVADGFVLTDADGVVLSVNASFVDQAQLASGEQAVGQPLERWLGRPGVDFRVLMVSLRQHGAVRLFSTVLRGDQGSDSEVEVSAVQVAHPESPRIGFTIRDVSRRIEVEQRTGRELPRSVEQLTGLVGRVSLKDLVRESTDLIEKLCIEAALELTHDNRASAAEMLGLSRQSLYVKLRRYGLGDLGADDDTEG